MKSTKAIAVANCGRRVVPLRRSGHPLAHSRRTARRASRAEANRPRSTTSVDLGQGRAAFCAQAPISCLIYNPALGAAAAKWIKLDSPLACDVTPLRTRIRRAAHHRPGVFAECGRWLEARRAVPRQYSQPQKEWHFTPAGVVDGDATQFVIADGEGKIYLVALGNEPQPHLQAVAEAESGPQPIESPLIVLGDTAIVGRRQLASGSLPVAVAATGGRCQSSGAGRLGTVPRRRPDPAGDREQSAHGNRRRRQSEVASARSSTATWPARRSPPHDSVLIAYRKGIVERRALADGKPLASADVEQPLAAGSVSFLQRLLLVANDGTLLVVDQP